MRGTQLTDYDDAAFDLDTDSPEADTFDSPLDADIDTIDTVGDESLGSHRAR